MGKKINALGEAILKESKKQSKLTEFEKAHAIAQKNAALPIEQGGLGLPADNTAMDRARAMGFDKDVYHGSYADIENIDPSKFSDRVDYMKGFFTADSPEVAGNYGDVIYPLKQKSGVQVSDRRLARREGKEAPELDTVFDTARGVNVTKNPSNIRSPNAAFDPLKRNSPNLLASAGAGAAVAGGALYTPEENQTQAGIVDKVGKKLYRGLEKPFDKNYNLSSTDAPQGYSTWTDNPELARQYAGDNGFIYEIELPKSREGLELIDSEGERALFVNNQKKAGLNNISGDEYLVYQGHDEFSPNMVNQYSQSNHKGAATPQSMAALAALSGGANAIYNAAKNNTLGEAANYAQDAANMVGYIPTMGMLTTSDIIGGIGKAGAAVTGNLDAYNANVSPYIESAGETKSQLGIQAENALSAVMNKAVPYVAPYAAPIINNLSQQWQDIENTPGEANLYGWLGELNRKANARLFKKK